MELFKAVSVIWREQVFKEQVLKECERMAEFYTAYLQEKMEGAVDLTDKALRILRLQAEGLSVEQIAKQTKHAPELFMFD